MGLFEGTLNYSNVYIRSKTYFKLNCKNKNETYGSFSKNGGICLSKIEKLSKIQHKLYCAYKIVYILDYKNQERFDLN